MKNAIVGIVLAAGLTLASYAQQLPRPSEKLVVQTIEGKTLDLKQYKGKYVVAVFLLTT